MFNIKKRKFNGILLIGLGITLVVISIIIYELPLSVVDARLFLVDGLLVLFIVMFLLILLKNNKQLKFLFYNKYKIKNSYLNDKYNKMYDITIGTIIKKIDLKKVNKGPLVQQTFLNIIASRKNDLAVLTLSRTLNPHTVIFGESGSGKTTLAKIIACNNHTSLNTIIIDFHGEYYNSLKKCGFCYVNAIDTIPNPFKTYGQRPAIRAMQLSFAFSRLFGFGRLQRSLLAELILDFYTNSTRLKSKGEPKSSETPTLKDFLDFIEEKISITEDLETKRRLNSIKSSLSLISDFLGQEKGLPLNECTKMVIDLNDLSISSLQEFVADLIIGEIYHGAKRSSDDYLLILDEAHRLLGSEKSSDMIRQIVQEGRKYGVFLVLATQNPLDLDSRIMNNISNRITFRMSEKKNLDYISRLLLSDVSSKELYKQVNDLIPNLPTGVGILRGSGKNNLIVFKTLDSLLGAGIERS